VVAPAPIPAAPAAVERPAPAPQPADAAVIPWQGVGQLSPAPVLTIASPTPGNGPCPTRPKAMMANPRAMLPAGETMDPRRRSDLDLSLRNRPATCEAAKAPLHELLSSDALSPPDRLRYFTWLARVCRGDDVPSYFLREREEPCSDVDWCHRPPCDVKAEACAQDLAARRKGTCLQLEGQRRLVLLRCEKLVRSEGTEDDVRAISSRAWCLEPESKRALDTLLRKEERDRAAKPVGTNR
jgi:hypothetical protein